jgi:mRNA-degrading endonuclease RelE of RelBE toxin-antitoxin system
VYEVLIERTAERDLKSLSTTLFDRIVPCIKALVQTLGEFLLESGKRFERSVAVERLERLERAAAFVTGEFGLGIIESSMKSMMHVNA